MRALARCAVVLAGMLAATTALAAADRLPKLPGDYIFARGEGSPGAVTFSHKSHVDAAKPTCLACHPRSFRILESGKDLTGQPLRHARFEAGAACGACHGKGKTAFDLDTCENCHH